MKKFLNKFLAVFVSFVMAIGMVPFSGFVADAATVVGDDTALTTVYKKVQPSDLKNGDQVLITYEGNVLVANTATKACKSDTTITVGADEITNPPKGSVWNLVESSGKYFFEVTEVESGDMPESKVNRLKVDDKGLRISDESSGFTLASDGRIYREKSGLPPYYAIDYENNDFIGQGRYRVNIGKATTFTFYKKTDVAKLTINYQFTDAEGNITSKQVVKSIDKGSTVNLDDYLSDINDYTFEKMTYNSKDYTDNQVTVNGNAQITAYYKKAQTLSFTVNFYVNGIKQDDDTIQKNVKEGTTESVDTSKYSSYDFKKLTVNDEKQTGELKSFTITKDTVVNYYYGDSLCPDEKLESDDEINEGDNPEYPAKGTVKIDKTAKSDDFNGTGVAKVELSTTGVPVKKGVDVVLLFDLSDSMDDEISTNVTKLSKAQDAATNFVEKVLTNSDGITLSNNRIALVTFAGYDNGAGNEVVYPLKNAEAKEQIVKSIEAWDKDSTKSGTDYTYAFEKANEILATSDTNRDKYIVFMTDGAPSKYNNLTWSNKDGFPVSSVVDKNGNVITELEGAKTAKSNSKTKVYSIGFGMTSNNNDNNNDSNNNDSNNGFTKIQAAGVLRSISSGDGYYIDATNAELLDNAFDKIAASIKKAGTEAVVTDTIGNSYNLQTTKTLPKNETQTENPQLSYDPTIEVNLYDLYTWADFNNGTITDKNKIGTRKSTTPINVETVTFNSTGTEAYSNLIKDESGKPKNIMTVNGNVTTIVAKNFTYTKTQNADGTDSEVITWTVGDITEQEATISYSVYLKGSLEGERGNGLYPTNEEAVLNYKNYLGNNTNKVFKKPTMPWGAAVVNYEFYLVNDKGEPVNSKNEVIPFENRVLIGKTEQKEFNWNNKTSLEASIEANKLVPDGYELYIKDSVYTANASSSGKGSCTIKETIPEGSSGAGENGSSTKVYDYDAGYTNSSVAFGVINKTTLIPDTIVLDYGKSIDIDVIKNDRVVNAKLDSIAKINTELKYTQEDGTTREIALGTDYTGFRLQGFEPIESIPTEQATIKVDNGVITYTPTKYMDKVDKFYYCASDVTPDGNGNDITSYRYQTVKVIPATTVYYEDNFGNTTDTNTNNGIVFSGNWTDATDGSTPEDKQDTKDVDEHPYGSDTYYQNDSKFSNGTAKEFIGDGTAPATATFTFKGTGFDLIGRTNNATGVIQCKVYRGEQATGTAIYTKTLDTVYTVENGDLYQIPLINWSTDTYDIYTVQITVVRNATFYVDAIRIYNPVGFNNTEANDQYKKDNEANAVIKEVRDLLISSNDFNEGKVTNGAVFMELVGEKDGKIVTNITDYANLGPNNEVYLKPGQSVAFRIRSLSKPKSVQIGAKAPEGSSNIMVGSGIDDKNISLTSATDMYYNITSNINWDITNDDGSVEGILVITNNCKEDNCDCIASITNLKLTYDNPSSYDVVINESTANKAMAVMSLRMTPNDVTSGDSTEDNTGDNTGGDSTEDNTGDNTSGDSAGDDTTESNQIKDFINSIFDKIFGWLK